MEQYWFCFFIPVIFFAIYSQKIDKAAAENKHLKTFLVGLCILLLIITAILLISALSVF